MAGLESSGDMTTTWSWEALGSLCEIVNGGTPDTSVDEFWGGDVVWLTPKDLGASETLFVGDSARKLTRPGLESVSTRIVPPMSVFLSTRAPIGHLGVSDVDACPGTGCKALLPNDELDALYLVFALKASIWRLRAHGRGVKFVEVGKRQLERFDIPVVSISRQKEIAQILGSAVHAAEIARKQHLLSVQLGDSLLRDLIPTHKSFNGRLIQ